MSVLSHCIFIIMHIQQYIVCSIVCCCDYLFIYPEHCRHLEWHNLEAVVNEDNSIDVREVTTDAREHLEFHDWIVKTSLGWGHLVVTTSTQCYIYKSVDVSHSNPTDILYYPVNSSPYMLGYVCCSLYSSRNWTTPVTVDLRAGSVSIIVQAERHFLIADSVSGVQIISYEVNNLFLYSCIILCIVVLYSITDTLFFKHLCLSGYYIPIEQVLKSEGCLITSTSTAQLSFIKFRVLTLMFVMVCCMS